MALSYHNETIVENNQFILNNYRIKRFKDSFLLTTDHGSWVLLAKEEYSQLIRNEVDVSLFKLLEEKGVIITFLNAEKIFHDYLHRYEFLFSGAALHIIVPTLRCNHRCIYCHSSSKDKDAKGYDMDKETMKKTIEFIFQTPANSFTIEFQGGDMLLNKPLFKEIINYAQELNKRFNKKVTFALVTNLTLMDPEFLDYLKKNDIRICTSLDGPEGLHNKNRPYDNGKGTYSDVMKWLAEVKKTYSEKVGALMVTTKHSLPFYKEIIDEYVRAGIKEIQIKYINRLGYAEKDWLETGYSVDEFIDFWKNSLDYVIKLNKKGTKIKSRYVSLILRKILTLDDPSFLDLRTPCGIVSGQLAYNYNGDIYCCDEGRNFEMFRLGNVKENSYKEVLSSPKAQTLIASSINDTLMCDACAYKPYCGVCPVINYAEEGNLLPKLKTNSKCRILKFMFDYVFEKLLFDEECKNIFFDWVTEWKNERHKEYLKRKAEDDINRH